MLTSGSGLERFMSCVGSSVLPRAFDANSNEHATRGQEIHAYLQRIGEGMKPADSLDLVDPEFRAAAEAVDLEQLKDILGLTAEMTFAYNPVFGTSRVLGVGLDREYDAAGLTEDEIPLTPDVVGLNHPTAPTAGIVVDYKEGWSKRTPAARNWQMKGAALALARKYDLDEVRVQLIHMRDGVIVYRDTATFTAADFAVFESEVRARWNLIPGARDMYLRAGIAPELTKGPWCTFCPSWHACPAQTSLVRAAVNRDAMEEQTRGPLRPEDVARAWLMLDEVEEPRKRLKSACLAAARERPVLLYTEADGTQVYLGMQETQGQTQIDADKAREVVREMLGPDAVDEVCSFEVTLKKIEAAAKKRVPKGKGAEKLRAIRDEMRKRGAERRPVKHEVGVYKIRPQIAAKAG